MTFTVALTFVHSYMLCLDLSMLGRTLVTCLLIE